MSNPIVSHYRAGSGAVLVETREETRFLRQLLADLPKDAQVCTIAAPSGQLKDARSGRVEKDSGGLGSAYQWAADGPGRVCIVYDWHMLANSPGHWRLLLENLPRLRCPKGARDDDAASLVVFVAPAWELSPQNPLRGSLPVLSFDLPDRDSLRTAAAKLRPLPPGADGETVIDALCGLSADSAEQSAAEVLARCNRWDTSALRDARRQQLREAGLELWPAVSELGGLGGLRTWIEAELLPWSSDETLSVRGILAAGVPGVGKSLFGRWLAGKIGCECCHLSTERCKAGIVGASGQNFRRQLATVDALGKHSGLVVVIDEVDKMATEGLDGGASSGMYAELLEWLASPIASKTVVIATLNRLSKIDAALESRFTGQFFFDLPTLAERSAIARIHLARVGCAIDGYADLIAAATDQFSSREIGLKIVPSIARQSNRKPTPEIISRICLEYTPTSRTQEEQLAEMRAAAVTLRRANDPVSEQQPTGRRVSANLPSSN